MIFKASRIKAEQVAIGNSNEDTSQNNELDNYKEILGLSYKNNAISLIPNRFKWGRSVIKIVD